MRTTGALRVILNAHLVAGMKFEPANDNCLRFTNVDGIYMIKVFFSWRFLFSLSLIYSIFSPG